MQVVRNGRRTRRQAALAALAVCGVLALTACQGGEDGTAPGAPTPSVPAVPSTTASTAAKPSAAASASKPAPKPTAIATGAKKPTPPAPAATCDHKMPIAPDLLSLRRYTPEGGSHNLIIQHGNWSCGSKDTEGATFEPVGKETFIPIAESAKITATAPIVTGVEPKPVTLHELISWVTAHPDSGLPFRYHLGADGAIDTLDEIYLSD
ncbi:hypothetical protein ACFWBN_10995 [Streptomyces sp. NPDC059989]|uniref:hypothetical protein n=1 Tax=Streptomyces sp. NPDC059989 TaxID=3347026 RepID=UPI0036D0F54F